MAIVHHSITFSNCTDAEKEAVLRFVDAQDICTIEPDVEGDNVKLTNYYDVDVATWSRFVKEVTSFA
jgi:hypothetical protein